MTVPGPAIVDQATLDWEGGEDANLATGSGIRWKLLIAGESTQSVGLITGIAEITPGAELMRHHHEPAETYYIMSGRGEMEIEGRTRPVGPRLRGLHPAGRPPRHPLHRHGAAGLRVLLPARPLRPDRLPLRSLEHVRL